MRIHRHAAIVGLISIALLLWLVSDVSSLLAAPPKQSPDVAGPFPGKSAAPTSFDGNLRQLSQPQSSIAKDTSPRLALRKSNATRAPMPSTINDAARQKSPGAATSLVSGVSFNGLDFNNWGSGWPPDPNGDIGPNEYIETVNTSIGIYTKAGLELVALTFNGLLHNAPYPCNNFNQGDPIVLYDAVSGRWILSDFSWYNVDNGPYYECIAVSKTGDPIAGGWWLYALQTDANYMGDYPKLGIWRDGIYMSVNLFDIYGGGCCGNPTGVRVWALNRNDLINGVPFQYVSFDLSTSYLNLLPTNVRGTLPPYGTPNFFASIAEPSTLHLWKFHVDWATPANSTFTGPTDLVVPAFVMPCYTAAYLNCVPQNGGESVDGLGDRLMMQLQYRLIDGVESLWVNHTVAADQLFNTPTGIRWYEIRQPNGSPELNQAATFQPDSLYRWMGSLAVDKDGNMALGYSVSSSTMYPAIRYTGRLVTDTLNILQTESTLIQGNGSQTGGYSRWGDYSAMTVDPTDDCTFWYVNEYYASTGNNWQTRIGSFKFSQCGTVTHWIKKYFPIIMR